MQALIGEFDEEKLCFPWAHPDPRVDELHKTVLGIVKQGESRKATRREIFRQIWNLVYGNAKSELGEAIAAEPIPHLSEPWYC